MLKTRLCELLGLDVPIILAPMGTCTSAELAAAVSNEGGLGASDRSFGPPQPSNATLTW
jgi:NAD(P)H-dependent flavin oxidoreductase YrpB (nitropropane dioxygenase family)